MFTDLVDYSGLAERLDPERLQVVQDRYFAAGREAVERHGGVDREVHRRRDHGRVRAAGGPRGRSAPGDPRRRATSTGRCGELGRALADLGRDDLQVRTGINTGEVVASGDAPIGPMVTGDAVNVAARLQQSAGPDQILVSGVDLSADPPCGRG